MERIDTLRGEYVALCAGGALTGEAAALIRRAAADGAELIYGDAVQTGADGRARPVFRPAWSPETLLSHNYAGSALVLAAELYARAGADGREDADALYALFHRAAALADGACHIPRTLFCGAPPPPCCNCRIVSDALRRLGRSGTVGQGLFIGSFDVRYGVAGEPLVSVIVRSEGDADAVGRTLESFEQRSAYRRFERIVADGTLPDARTRAWYRALHERRAATVVAHPGETNAAQLVNEAARHARGDLLLFLDAGLTLGAHDALERLIEQVQQPGVAAAGGKVVDGAGRLVHAGLAFCPCAPGSEAPRALFAGRRDALTDRAQNLYANCTRDVSAVSGALLVGAQRFFSLGGFDETFAAAHLMAALCVRIAGVGGRVVYTPYARFIAAAPSPPPPLPRRSRERCTDLFRPLCVHGDPMLSQNPEFLRLAAQTGAPEALL